MRAWHFIRTGLIFYALLCTILAVFLGELAFRHDGFLLRAIPTKGNSGGRGRPSYWQVDSKNQIYLMWNDGFTGVTLKLKKDGDGLRGWAHLHFDSPHVIPRTSHVVARRIDCSGALTEPKTK
jgi:hypothetical protein